VNVDSNWWQTFFTGVAVDMWVEALPPDYTREEASTIERALAAPPGSNLLDVPCGAGRLSLVLASRGFRLTGVDLSDEFLGRARGADPGNTVQWEHRDMRDLPWRDRFEGAFCVGNSFAYLDDSGNLDFLRAVASALKPSARFVLETPMVLESLLRSLKDRFWVKAGEVHLLVHNQYDAARGRLDIEYTFVRDGRVETRTGTHRAYTYRQLVDLIEAGGLALEAASPWTPDLQRVILTARRR